MTGQSRSLTAACRASLTVLSCLYSGAAVCLVPASTSTVAKDAPAPKIHVFIVGVPSWQMKDYKPVSPATDTVLGRSIVSACDDIRRFFTERFADQNSEMWSSSIQAWIKCARQRVQRNARYDSCSRQSFRRRLRVQSRLSL